MPLGENELARRSGGGLLLRPEPLRVRWEFADLLTSDGHSLRCLFTASIRAIPDRTERQMLEELLLDGRSALCGEDVARHFSPALRGAAARVAQQYPASDWVSLDSRASELVESLKQAATPVAFACGVEFLPPFQVDLHSPTFERQRSRALQQSLTEKEAAGQLEHFQRAAELLKQFHQLRQAAPELSAAQIFEQVSPADRGSLMQSLLMAGAKEQASADLWAVAGPYLVEVRAASPIDGRTPPRAQLFPLPPTLGPLRSVRAQEVEGERRLLVGAQHGVLLIDPASGSATREFADPDSNSPLGFNRAVYWPQARMIFATHSEAGLLGWNLDQPSKPAVALRPAAMGVAPMTPAASGSSDASASMSLRMGGSVIGPRNLCQLDADRLIFSLGNTLLAWDGKGLKPLAVTSGAEIVAIVIDDRRLFTIHEDGFFCEVDRSAGRVLSAERRSGKLRAVGVLPWLDGARLLLAGEDGPVQCVGLGDPLTTHYSSAYRALRALAASRAMVAGVSPDRQRLVLWNSWDGRQPATELFISAQTRHRIADLCIA